MGVGRLLSIPMKIVLIKQSLGREADRRWP